MKVVISQPESGAIVQQMSAHRSCALQLGQATRAIVPTPAAKCTPRQHGVPCDLTPAHTRLLRRTVRAIGWAHLFENFLELCRGPIIIGVVRPTLPSRCQLQGEANIWGNHPTMGTTRNTRTRQWRDSCSCKWQRLGPRMAPGGLGCSPSKTCCLRDARLCHREKNQLIQCQDLVALRSLRSTQCQIWHCFRDV